MIDGTAVNAIRDIAQGAQAGEGKLVEIEGVKYSTVKLTDVREPDPEPKPIVVSTLSGLVGYVKKNIDELKLASALVHVEGHDRVELVSALKGRFQQRYAYAAAACPNRFAAATAFAFGKWLLLEDLIISLQVLFDDAWDRKTVLALLGNVKDEYLKSSQDDGVSQTVSAKAGIVLQHERAVPNPVVLAPFRTFDEVQQPSSKFVFRLRKDENQAMRGALFEADGGAWRTVATRAIATYLREALGDSVTVID